MQEIKCPKCGSVIKVDEADYALILSQVKTHEFDAEVEKRLAELKKQMELQQQNDEQRAASAHQLALSQKQQEVTALQGEIQTLKT